MSLTSDPRVRSLIPARSHTFVQIDYEIISTVILLPSAESFIRYKRKYVQQVLVNCLFKQEKVWLGELPSLHAQLQRLLVPNGVSHAYVVGCYAL